MSKDYAEHIAAFNRMAEAVEKWFAEVVGDERWWG